MENKLEKQGHSMNNPNIISITIDNETEGARLDKALSFSLPETSRTYLQKLIEMGMVAVNGATCYSKKYLVKQDDLLEVNLPEPETLNVVPEDLNLSIVYEDEDLLVVDKPKGMVVHPAPGNLSGTLVNGILHHCQGQLSTINGVIRPGIVHRIDKDTTGLLLVAKNDVAHHSLAEQLAAHTIKRGYLAIVYNNFPESTGRIDAPIGRDPGNRLRQKVTDKNAKEAITNYSVVERLGQYTLIEARLETGRTHQIRVHMAYKGHPLLGDYVYGPKKNSFNVDGQLLHAYLLGFVHPKTGQYLEFQSPLPSEFEQILNRLRKGTNEKTI
jgi:23S rRNA pseudouridine1911/1915/1917 synthase